MHRLTPLLRGIGYTLSHVTGSVRTTKRQKACSAVARGEETG